MGVVDHLEDQGGEGGVLGRGTFQLDLGIAGIGAGDRRDLGRVREVLDDRVDESLHADVLEGRAAEDGVAFEADGALADRRPDLVVVTASSSSR